MLYTKEEVIDPVASSLLFLSTLPCRMRYTPPLSGTERNISHYKIFIIIALADTQMYCLKTIIIKAEDRMLRSHEGAPSNSRENLLLGMVSRRQRAAMPTNMVGVTEAGSGRREGKWDRWCESCFTSLSSLCSGL